MTTNTIPDTQPILEIDDPGLTHPTETLRRERWAFYCLLGDLLKTHKGQFVAVSGKRVVASGPNRGDVYRQAVAAVGAVPMFVGLVSDEPPPLESVPRSRLGQRGASR